MTETVRQSHHNAASGKQGKSLTGAQLQTSLEDWPNGGGMENTFDSRALALHYDPKDAAA